MKSKDEGVIILSNEIKLYSSIVSIVQQMHKYGQDAKTFIITSYEQLGISRLYCYCCSAAAAGAVVVVPDKDRRKKTSRAS